jgi:GTPase
VDKSFPAGKAIVVTFRDEFAQREIAGLAEAGGYKVEATMTQRQVVRSEYGVGVGKAEELSAMAEDTGAKTIIIDDSITSAQANKLAATTHTQVIDRERLILNIFAFRATTAEAKLQVQLAELQYELPRARELVNIQLAREQAGFSGMGEYAVDVKFRDLKRRMSFVKAKLEKARTTKKVQSVERKKLDIPFISLAGYTSSGKTTLFNRLTSESKEESPKLFTTLATTTRSFELAPGRRALLSDTVGFISRLPTYLVESFKSTLEELKTANVVLLLVDASEPAESVRIKFESCRQTLAELGVDPQRILLVLNKIDLIEGGGKNLESQLLFSDYQTARISASKGVGLRKLNNAVAQKLSRVPL